MLSAYGGPSLDLIKDIRGAAEVHRFAKGRHDLPGSSSALARQSQAAAAGDPALSAPGLRPRRSSLPAQRVPMSPFT